MYLLAYTSPSGPSSSPNHSGCRWGCLDEPCPSRASNTVCYSAPRPFCPTVGHTRQGRGWSGRSGSCSKQGWQKELAPLLAPPPTLPLIGDTRFQRLHTTPVAPPPGVSPKIDWATNSAVLHAVADVRCSSFVMMTATGFLELPKPTLVIIASLAPQPASAHKKNKDMLLRVVQSAVLPSDIRRCYPPSFNSSSTTTHAS